MPDRDLDSLFSQSLDDIAIGDVAALHLIAEIVHDLGDARHADAADADEMDGADVGRDAAHHLSPARVAATPLATAALREGAPTRLTSIIGGAASRPEEHPPDLP